MHAQLASVVTGVIKRAAEVEGGRQGCTGAAGGSQTPHTDSRVSPRRGHPWGMVCGAGELAIPMGWQKGHPSAFSSEVSPGPTWAQLTLLGPTIEFSGIYTISWFMLDLSKKGVMNVFSPSSILPLKTKQTKQTTTAHTHTLTCWYTSCPSICVDSSTTANISKVPCPMERTT